MTIAKVSGLNHITLAVHDLDVSWHFYTAVLGCHPLTRWPKGAYLLAGDLWLALILDQQTRLGPLPEYTHIAFAVAPDDFIPLSEQIRAAGAPLWQENTSEGDSLYFLDPNGHKLEIHTTSLAMRLQSAQANPWPGLVFFNTPEEI